MRFFLLLAACSSFTNASPDLSVDLAGVDLRAPDMARPVMPGDDLCAGMITDKAAHHMTPLAKPGLGQTVVDAEFGTTIRRITAVSGSGANTAIVPMYTTISAW